MENNQLPIIAATKDGFARLFALALYSYENGIPETIKEIKSEITRRNKEKPKLVSTARTKQSKGEIEHNI